MTQTYDIGADEQKLIQDVLDTMHRAEWDVNDTREQLEGRLNDIRDTMRFVARERSGVDPYAEDDIERARR